LVEREVFRAVLFDFVARDFAGLLFARDFAALLFERDLAAGLLDDDLAAVERVERPLEAALATVRRCAVLPSFRASPVWPRLSFAFVRPRLRFFSLGLCSREAPAS
jgi:hypothetical protein